MSVSFSGNIEGESIGGCGVIYNKGYGKGVGSHPHEGDVDDSSGCGFEGDDGSGSAGGRTGNCCGGFVAAAGCEVCGGWKGVSGRDRGEAGDREGGDE